jgi:hypothetical protein
MSAELTLGLQAPLAWISGVMELNIKGFTPEDEAWTVGTLVWASREYRSCL